MKNFEQSRVANHIRNTMNLKAEKQPLILLHSSSEDAMIFAKCKDLDIPFTIVKPIKMKELYDALNKICSKQSLSSQSIKKTHELLPHTTEHIHLILIAEDVQLNMLLVKAFLSQYFPSFHIIEAYDGIQAVEMYKRHNPDLIIMDCQMPNMDGFEATKQIRQVESTSSMHVPIIALTAGVIKGEKERCYSAGMDYYLTKPIDQTSFHKTIGKFLALDKGADEHSHLQNSPSVTHFDISNLKERLNNDEKVLEDLIIEARRSFPIHFDTIEKHFRNGNFEEFYFNVHELKGASITMSFDPLAQLALQLQSIPKDDVRSIESMLIELRKEFDLVDQELRM